MINVAFIAGRIFWTLLPVPRASCRHLCDCSPALARQGEDEGGSPALDSGRRIWAHDDDDDDDGDDDFGGPLHPSIVSFRCCSLCFVSSLLGIPAARCSAVDVSFRNMTAHIGSSQVKHSREEGRGSGLLSRKSRVRGLGEAAGTD